jgi:hypothetical protein
VRRGRVVDEHVEAAEPRERLRDEALGVGGSTHVAHEREDAAPEALDLGGQALEPLPALADLLEALFVLVPRPAGGDIGRDDVGAGAREGDRDRAAHPLHAPAPGDQHALSFEVAHGKCLPVPDDTAGASLRPGSARAERPQVSPFSLALPTTRGSHGPSTASISR